MNRALSWHETRALKPVTTLPSDEAGLGERLACGDRGAAERLVEQTYSRIYGALYKLCDGDADRAGDLTQETYRKAWAALASFRADCLFSTWLYRIAYNTFLTAVRRPRPLALHEAPPQHEPGPSTEERVAAAQSRRRVRRAVLALPEPLRWAVTARYWGELTSPEIARLEGLSAVGVRKRLLRGLAALEQALEEER
jgi:RNA polymerase sigma-70 factor (ECF subfamily)